MLFLSALPYVLSRRMVCEHAQPSEVSLVQVRPDPGRTLAPSRIRITQIYTSWGYDQSSKIGRAIKILNSGAISFVERLLSVRTIKFTLNIYNCNEVKLPENLLNKEYNTDLLIFIATANAVGVRGAAYQANAIYCAKTSSTPQRPLIGRVLWNQQRLSDQVFTAVGYQTLSRIFLHQLIHILAFSRSNFQDFVSQPATQTVGQRTYVVTPRVKLQVAKYYQCHELGMPLQDQGSPQSAGQHWEKDVLLDQLMTADFLLSSYLFISNFTLSLIEDSGFYDSVNYAYAESAAMSFGRKKGCPFLSAASCSQEGFCPQLTQSGLDLYSSCASSCRENTFTKCPVMQCFSNRICRSETYKGITGSLSATLEKPGYNSRGYLATTGVTTETHVRCLPTRCSVDGLLVYITVGKEVIRCLTPEAKVKGGSFEGQVTCPSDIVQFCLTLKTVACRDFCGSTAVCVNGQCVPNKLCPEGKYPDPQLVCAACHPTCSICFSGLPCLNCPGSTFELDSQCYPCQSSCLTCSGVEACDTCREGFFLDFDGLCINCLGQSQYSLVHKGCLCKKQPLFYFNNTCSEKCPANRFTFNRLCVGTCPPGYSPDNSLECRPCSLNCATTYSISKVTTTGDQLLLDLSFANESQLNLSTLNFQVKAYYLQLNAPGKVQQSTLRPHGLSANAKTIQALVQAPSSTKANYHIRIYVVDLQLFGKISNTGAAASFHSPGLGSEWLVVAGRAISLALLPASLAAAFFKSNYNLMLTPQLITWSLFYHRQSLDYYRVSQGYKYSNLLYLNLMPILYPQYFELAPPGLAPFSNASILYNMNVPILASVILAVLFFVGALLLTNWRNSCIRTGFFCLNLSLLGVFVLGLQQLLLSDSKSSIEWIVNSSVFVGCFIQQLVLLLIGPKIQLCRDYQAASQFKFSIFLKERAQSFFSMDALRRILFAALLIAAKEKPVSSYGLLIVQGLALVHAFVIQGWVASLLPAVDTVTVVFATAVDSKAALALVPCASLPVLAFLLFTKVHSNKTFLNNEPMETALSSPTGPGVSQHRASSGGQTERTMLGVKAMPK